MKGTLAVSAQIHYDYNNSNFLKKAIIKIKEPNGRFRFNIVL